MDGYKHDGINDAIDTEEMENASKYLIRNAAIDIANSRKNALATLFKRSPKIYYEMAVDSNKQPYGRYYQNINGKDKIIHMRGRDSALARICRALNKYNNLIMTVSGELSPDMFNSTYTMIKENPNARVDISFYEPKTNK